MHIVRRVDSQLAAMFPSGASKAYPFGGLQKRLSSKKDTDPERRPAAHLNLIDRAKTARKKHVAADASGDTCHQNLMAVSTPSLPPPVRTTPAEKSCGSFKFIGRRHDERHSPLQDKYYVFYKEKTRQSRHLKAA